MLVFGSIPAAAASGTQVVSGPVIQALQGVGSSGTRSHGS
jgi:hypothetical protein